MTGMAHLSVTERERGKQVGGGLAAWPSWRVEMRCGPGKERAREGGGGPARSAREGGREV
jgi:hypothetical protein